MIDVMLHRHRHRSTHAETELPNRSPAPRWAWGQLTLNLLSCVLWLVRCYTSDAREVTRHRTHDSLTLVRVGRQVDSLELSPAQQSAQASAHNVQKHELHDMFSYHDDITRPSCDPARPHAWAHATRRRRARVPRAGAAPGTRTRIVHAPWECLSDPTPRRSRCRVRRPGGRPGRRPPGSVVWTLDGAAGPAPPDTTHRNRRTRIT